MKISLSGIQSLECSESLKQAMGRYAGELAEAIGDDLLGIYLYGSLARGCHHPVTSDVDIIAVIKGSGVEPDKQAILQVHRNAGVSMDVVFVDERQVNMDVLAVPVCFLVKVKSMDDCTIVDVPEGRRDFLLQRQDTYEAGIALLGPTPQDLISPVPWPLLSESLDFLFPYIVTHFKNSVLMLCRIAYAWTHHKLCSKKQAGEWAGEEFGEHWEPVIKAALAEYAGGEGTGISKTTLHEFEQYCVGYIDNLRAD